MQAGFALCEAGFTRAKNTGNSLMKNMMDFCIGTPCYWLIGFGLMFGGTGALDVYKRQPSDHSLGKLPGKPPGNYSFTGTAPAVRMRSAASVLVAKSKNA